MAPTADLEGTASCCPPKIRRLTVQLTRHCNLNCYYCYCHPQHGSNVSGLHVEKLLSFLENCKPYSSGRVVLTGGEPLLHPHIEDIFRFLADGGFYVALETNGSLLADKYLDSINVNGGHIAVTLESTFSAIHDKIRGKRGSWDESVAALKVASSYSNITTQFTFNLTTFSQYELTSALELGEELGIARIKLNPIYRIGPRGSTSVDKYLDLHGLLRIANQFEQLVGAWPFKVDLALPPSFLTSKTRYTGSQCAGCDLATILGVLYDGTIRPCHNFMYDTDKTAFGSIYGSYSLPEILEGIGRLPGASPWTIEGICGRCALLPHCKGFCRAQANADYFNTDKASKLCTQLHCEGLFPQELLVPDIIASASL